MPNSLQVALALGFNGKLAEDVEPMNVSIKDYTVVLLLGKKTKNKDKTALAVILGICNDKKLTNVGRLENVDTSQLIYIDLLTDTIVPSSIASAFRAGKIIVIDAVDMPDIIDILGDSLSHYLMSNAVRIVIKEDKGI